MGSGSILPASPDLRCLLRSSYDDGVQESPLHERLLAIVGDRSFRELAELTQTNHETVRRYMQGHPPSVEFVAALCTQLRINGQWLLTGRGPMRAADIRSDALGEARASELLGAIAGSLERLQERIDRVESYVHTMEARLRGRLKASPILSGERHVDPATTDPAVLRARTIADAVPQPAREDHR